MPDTAKGKGIIKELDHDSSLNKHDLGFFFRLNPRPDPSHPLNYWLLHQVRLCDPPVIQITGILKLLLPTRLL